AGVPGAGGQCDVDGAALRARPADLVGEPGAGEQGAARLVQRDRQHPRVVPEGGLHAVTVVRVDVDVGDLLDALLQQPGDGDGRVVVDAEAGSGRGHRVVESTRDVDRVVVGLLEDGAGGGQGAAGDQRGGFVHVGEHRVVHRAEAVPRIGTPGAAGLLDRVEVRRRVHEHEQRVGGGF